MPREHKPWTSAETETNCPAPERSRYSLKRMCHVPASDALDYYGAAREGADGLMEDAREAGIILDDLVEVRAVRCPSGCHVLILAYAEGEDADA